MAAAAGATEFIRSIDRIVIVPFVPPVMLAQMVASVDQVSGGRLDFGIGISGQARHTRRIRRPGHLHPHAWAVRTDEIAGT